jgi:hypothetical protein
VSRLDQKHAQIAPAVAAETASAADALAAVVDRGSQPDVGDEFLVVLKTVDVSDNGHQSESDALGVDPVTAGSGRGCWIFPASPGMWGFRFKRAQASLTYIAETSSDLVAWTPLWTNPGQAGEYVDIYLDGTLTRQFARVRIEEP